MTSLPTQAIHIFTGIILLKNKIAAHTYHIRIQSQDFSRIQYSPGLMIEFYLSNPYYTTKSEVQPYAFWDYDPIHHIADFAISIRDKEWIKEVQEGDSLFFRQASEQLVPDHTGDHYFLIGDIKALSHLYEMNRALPVSKKISSLIYTEHEEEVFPDLDHSFPLKTCIINPIHAVSLQEKIQEYFPNDSQDTIVYLFGDPLIGSVICSYLKNNPLFDIRTIYLNGFCYG
ncbi:MULTISPECIES: hypothetical protein [Chryseobacterium]|uniref:hypothetical protein n=1 Tax=Chryseobacterium TaxID=59732 RepID=UPI001920F2D8|nr:MULTISPECIES: hypothetical protein [Chryseobacterium]MBL3547714.1 hypothetical protein [Chryseobacterium sp. KMC2]MDR6547862.1 hypothetical protein [Chryseobacterium rhizosphaerae]